MPAVIVDRKHPFSSVRDLTCLPAGAFLLFGRLLDHAIDPFNEHIQREAFAYKVSDA